ncbi:MAG: GtrA family protein [Actinomycetia bacterium]|nr:GtrA family protein [Actinomycetes bacterium]
MKNYLKTFANKESLVQAMKVGAVGAFNTVGTFVIFNAMRMAGLSVFVAITVAYVITTFLSYLINRRWTFSLVDGHVSGRETAAFFGVNIVAYLASLTIVWLADQLFGPLSRIGENVALLVAAMILILPKLASYRDLVFGRALREKMPSDSPQPSAVSRQPESDSE